MTARDGQRATGRRRHRAGGLRAAAGRAAPAGVGTVATALPAPGTSGPRP